MARNQLIVQLRAETAEEFERCVEVEDALIQAFSQNTFAEVDGHDVGDGRFNIFIYPTDTWAPVVERVHAFLKLKGVLGEAVVTKRIGNSGRLKVIWPSTYTKTFEL